MQLSRKQRISIALVLLPVVFIWQVNGFYVEALARTSLQLFWIIDFVQWVVLPVVLIVALAKKASIFPKHYGLGTSALRWQSPVLGTLAVFITGYLSYVWATPLSWQWLDSPTGYFHLPNVFPNGLVGKIVWLYSSLTAGVVESIFFIGLPWLLYRNIGHQASRGVFTALASVIFALAHWEQGPHVVVGALFFNVIACFWFFRLGTLWPIVAGHILVDLVNFS